MHSLSIIMPYVNEYPQVVFTIAALLEELRGQSIDFEILAVDNASTDKGGAYLASMAAHNPEIRALAYTEKLSHWQAKNHAIKCARFDTLLFMDAHCVVGRGSLAGMLDAFADAPGTLHLPLTYHILEKRKLIYALRADLARAEVHYSFGSLRQDDGILTVPCMSTCGMMIRKGLLEKIGLWPSELGIYGGGENFLNFTLATLNVPIQIYCKGVLHHHGERRGYSWNHSDYLRNRAIAAYCYGGKDFARKFLFSRNDPADGLNKIYDDIIDKCSIHRNLIKPQQIISIGDWVSNWSGAT